MNDELNATNAELSDLEGETAIGAEESRGRELARFWGDAAGIEALELRIGPPEKPLAILEKLGPSPFERGGFPLIGFLATAYEKVSRYALERGEGHSPM